MMVTRIAQRANPDLLKPSFGRGGTLIPALDGKRVIKRSETVPASRYADEAPGIAAIIETSLLAADARGS